ncbi:MULTISPECIES: putative baseplate assembly protein [Methylomonas]|uniref:putative baseplate assembly protein n=1 Tax=Methylomonas TaxID=416 RepID=UPI0012325B0D|nr:putative baseplate assembly protein [Methylomonas rhizoryzae]
MPLPVPNLDDRRFDDLVAEAKARLANHLPELTQISPGDPLNSFIDLFAWLTETILYRANLIPERQRRVLLNLLQIPERPARPAKGIVSVDAGPTSVLAGPLLADGSQLRAGKQVLTAVGELQPTCLSLQVLIKRQLQATELAALGLTLQDLQQQYGLRADQIPQPFQPRRLVPGKDSLDLSSSLDRSFYLACIAPRQLAEQMPALRDQLAGLIFNVGIAPADALEGDSINELNPRKLVWELMTVLDERTSFIELDVLADSSRGARQAGVVRLRLPKNAGLLQAFAPADPMQSGLGELPPEPADQVAAERVAFWLRVRSPDYPNLQLAYLGINAVDVLAQGLKQDLLVGIGSGQPDQVVALPDKDVDAATLQLDVEENGSWVRWQRVDFLAGQAADAKVYRLNPQAGYVYFGDGSTGLRPPAGARIRAAAYLYGGGSAGNLPAGSIKELVNGSSAYKVRHDWPLSGGLDAETVDQAEKRIPQFLTHRNRAVTARDFKIIAEANPVNPVARAEVLPGFLPGASIRSARDGVPGAISVFVLPPGQPAIGHTPKPNQGLLKDVFAYLLQRVLVGTELYVLSPEFVPVAISVRIDVLDPETEQQTLRDVRLALIDYLWPLPPGGPRGGGWPFYPQENDVRQADLLPQVARVAGVQAIHAVALFQKNSNGWRRLNANQAVELAKYQLPELMGVRVETGPGTPGLPEGIGPLEGQSPATGLGVAVPVIPDIC